MRTTYTLNGIHNSPFFSYGKTGKDGVTVNPVFFLCFLIQLDYDSLIRLGMKDNSFDIKEKKHLFKVIDN